MKIISKIISGVMLATVVVITSYGSEKEQYDLMQKRYDTAQQEEQAQEKKLSVAKERATSWFALSDDEIKEIITKGTLDPRTSPLHATIAHMITTYNKMMPLEKKAKEEHDKRVQEWEQTVKTFSEQGRGDEIPPFPDSTRSALSWCGCINPADRVFFAISMVKEALNKYPDLQQKFVFTSLGAGDLLQDLIIIQGLVDVGYSDLVINVIEHDYKNKQLPVLSKFRKELVQLQTKKIKAKKPVKIEVKPYISVDTYARSKPKNEKINMLSLVDVGATFSAGEATMPQNLTPEQLKKWAYILLPQTISQVYIRVSNTTVDTTTESDSEGEGSSSEGADILDCVIIIPPHAANYGYIKETEKADESIMKTVKRIIDNNIKNRDDIFTVLQELQTQNADRWAKDNKDVFISSSANVLYDLKRLCNFAYDDAVVYFFDVESEEEHIDLAEFEEEKTKLLLQEINPRTFDPDILIKQELKEDDWKPIR